MKESGILSIHSMGFRWKTRDPFLYCVYHVDQYPKGNDQFGPDASLKGRNIGQDFEAKDGWRMYHGIKVPGFPAHPHRGFETITVTQTGYIDHSDSMGSSGRYGMGDVQWMTAGKGVQHAEMFPLLNRDSSNTTEMFQIWLNLPAKNKMVEPHYKMFWNEKIPVVSFKDQNDQSSKVKLIAGQLENQTALQPPPNSWASEPSNGIVVWIIEMEPNAVWILPSHSANLNRTLYFYEGKAAKLNSTDVLVMHSIDLISDIECKIENGNLPAKFLLLQGRAIDEPIAQYGPFVMNTEREIQQAFWDFQKTQFGGWPWNSPEPIHSKSKERFIKMPDGTEDRVK